MSYILALKFRPEACLLVFLLFLPGLAFGRKVPVTVYDCENHSPVSNVQIFDERHDFLGTTDEKGEALIVLFKDKTVTFSKLGYQDKTLPSGQLNAICLERKLESISEVAIHAKRANYFDTLTQLRNKNRAGFLDFDALLTYSFDYVATSLKDSSLIDSASGNFTVYYEQGYEYPNLFANSNRHEKVNAFHYEYNKSLPESYFSRIKYLYASGLLCCYDMMEKKFNQPDWWNYLGMEAEKSTKVFSKEDGSRQFATYTKDGKLSKRFYFDKKGVIGKIEIFRPMFFFQGNYDDKNCKFFVAVNYTQEYPRVASKVTYTYEVDSVALPYRVTMHLRLTGPQAQTIRVAKGSRKKVVLSLVGSFHQIYLNIEDAREKGWLEE